MSINYQAIFRVFVLIVASGLLALGTACSDTQFAPRQGGNGDNGKNANLRGYSDATDGDDEQGGKDGSDSDGGEDAGGKDSGGSDSGAADQGTSDEGGSDDGGSDLGMDSDGGSDEMDMGSDGGKDESDDGKDDGDLVFDEDEVSCEKNDLPDPYTIGPGPGVIRDRLNEVFKEENLPLLNHVIRYSTNASGGGKKWNSVGTPEVDTLTKVCNLLGFENYSAPDCYDTERSGNYGSGKCNFHSPGDNALAYYDKASDQWRVQQAPDKYKVVWLSTITCEKKICKEK